MFIRRWRNSALSAPKSDPVSCSFNGNRRTRDILGTILFGAPVQAASLASGEQLRCLMSPGSETRPVPAELSPLLVECAGRRKLLRALFVHHDMGAVDRCLRQLRRVRFTLNWNVVAAPGQFKDQASPSAWALPCTLRTGTSSTASRQQQARQCMRPSGKSSTDDSGRS